MTDREMLELCLKAFEAIPTAQTSKLFMKRMSWVHVVYSGAAPYRLAKKMQQALRDHLGIKEG